MALLNSPSFNSLDHQHFIATGEHLTPRVGDACPMPSEFYIKRTTDRQQRTRLYNMLSGELRGEDLMSVKPSTIAGIYYTAAKWGTSYDPERCIQLYDGVNEVATIWADGRERQEPSVAHSPAPPFVMRPPWQHDPPSLEDLSTGIAEIRRDRIRPNFRRILSEMPQDALWAELEEWQEEVERSKEHVAAIEAEFAKRRGCGKN